ncbi:DUF4913 domain-containing protein [Streptomyces sp. NPDC096094]|uniref:DUF4913 domain-containing protein n=1 Tax=Streptomyces sp. NPDC096094 TaxID=3366073 RepID=UPI00381CAE2B
MAIVDEWADDPEPTEETGAASPRSKPGKTKKTGKTKKAAKDEPPPLVYQSVNEFMTEWLAPVIRRKIDGQTLTWCPRWWAHPEVLTRVNALWRAWEHLRLDPALGMSMWFLHHCDPHLRQIMDGDTGPLAKCSINDGHEMRRPLEPLPLETADPALWLDPAFSTEAGSSTAQ